MPHDWISVRGARVHNLKDIDVDIPRDKLVVITGLSGSGKSSLAFDTLYAEGQRRYVESLSAYARQFLEQMEKPDVDLIEGLSPAISIEQKTTGSNPRSTVGTVTEIYDYLRLLFANIGVPHCPSCGREITSQSIERIVDLVMTYPQDTRITVMAPLVRGRKGEFKKELQALAARGFTRARVDGQLRSLEEDMGLDRRRNHNIDVIVDRLIVRSGIERRLAASVEVALQLADDVVTIQSLEQGDRLYSRKLACVVCGISVPEMSARAFSFNSPHGACQACQGLGATWDFDPRRIVPDDSKSLAQGAIAPWARGDAALVGEALARIGSHWGIETAVPFGKLPKKQRDLLLFGPSAGARGVEDDRPKKAAKGSAASRKKAAAPDPFGRDFEGVIPNLRRRFDEGSWAVQEELDPYRALAACAACEGRRLRPESLGVTVKGRTIAEYVDLPVSDALAVFEGFALGEREALIAARILKEVQDRLRFLNDVGVGYLTLGRSAATLSGGEGQRIRLATQIGSNLTGVLYVLDEPSIGLHQRDNRKLLSTLARLRDMGNTVVVVEHDEDTIRTADYVIDLGPGAGDLGGEVIFQGAPGVLARNGHGSLTGAYLSGHRRIEAPARRRTARQGELVIRGARANNLKDIDVKIPLAGQRHPVQVARASALQGRRRARRACAHRGHEPHRQGHRDRPVAHRPHAAIESRHVHRPLHVHSRAVRDGARGPGARLQARALLVQREGRALRGVPGRWGHRHRDALPAQRVRDVRAVQGPPLQPRDAGREVPREVHRRGPGPDRRSRAAAARELPADRDEAPHAAERRARLHRARPVGDDAVGRRGAAREAVA